MNKKLKLSLNLIFFSACALCIITDVIFPYVAFFIKGCIIIGVAGMLWTAGLELQRYNRALNRKNKETFYNLIFKFGWKYRIVNLITLYRILIVPVLLVMLFEETPGVNWLLLSAFITDALDGFFARRWKVTTKTGSRMDSFADDILFVFSLLAVIYYHVDFIWDHIQMIGALLLLFLVKMFILWFKHSRLISSMHTYLTKAAAFSQAAFFLHSIFFDPSIFLFNVTIIVTMIAIVEEIIIICMLRELKQNIKGLFFHRSQL